MEDSPALVRCDIVSTEKELFSGEISFLSVTGIMGELGIAPGHAPLLTEMRPGPALLRMADGTEEVFYISGGYLEVQATRIMVLADTAQHSADIDENAVRMAREEAERAVQERVSNIDYGRAAARLAETAAQLRALQALRNRKGAK